MFAENFAVYGVHKVWRQMRREGFAAACCTVKRLNRNRPDCRREHRAGKAELGDLADETVGSGLG